MSIEIDLQEFILEGNFGPITFGDSYEKVTSILREEYASDIFSAHPDSKDLHYGSLRLGFGLEDDKVFRVYYITLESLNHPRGFGRWAPIELPEPLTLDKRSRRAFFNMSEKEFFWIFPELRRKMKIEHEEYILKYGAKNYMSPASVQVFFSNSPYEGRSTKAFRLESIMCYK